MKTQWEIEREWDVAKLLITNIDFKLLLYTLPQYGLYIQSLVPIPICYKDGIQEFPIRYEDEDQFEDTKLRFEDAKLPYVVTVRTEDLSRVADFIQECPEFRSYRIFKHGMSFRGVAKENVIGIVCETTKNMLHLYPGKTFYISSKDKKLRQIFYEKAVEINEEDDLGCSFDYDEYDYTLEIRAYKRFKEERLIAEDGNIVVENVFHRWAIVTILYGEDLPNSWNMGDRKRGEL